MRQLAYIETIKSLSPIPNADKIEKAEVLGWELVVKKSEFNVGDLCVYVEIDSILPDLPPFEFLRQKKFRIRTQKIRSQISQGIAFPLSIIKEVDPSFDISKLKVGDDVTAVLKIVKHDPEAEADDFEPEKKSWWSNKYSYYKWKLFKIKPVKSGSFPFYVPKTDEVRVQKMGSALEKEQGDICYISEKCEGQSATFVYKRTQGNFFTKFFSKDYLFLACSRNRIVYNSNKGGTSTNNVFKIAQKYNLEQVMKKINRNLAIQGEIIGPKIQQNIYKLEDVELRVFLIFDIDAQKYLDFSETQALIQQMNLPFVPVLETYHCIKNDIKYYVELSKGFSKINPKVLREGIVVRSMSKNFSFKSINPEYLLKQESNK